MSLHKKIPATLISAVLLAGGLYSVATPPANATLISNNGSTCSVDLSDEIQRLIELTTKLDQQAREIIKGFNVPRFSVVEPGGWGPIAGSRYAAAAYQLGYYLGESLEDYKNFNPKYTVSVDSYPTSPEKLELLKSETNRNLRYVADRNPESSNGFPAQISMMFDKKMTLSEVEAKAAEFGVHPVTLWEAYDQVLPVSRIRVSGTVTTYWGSGPDYTAPRMYFWDAMTKEFVYAYTRYANAIMQVNMDILDQCLPGFGLSEQEQKLYKESQIASAKAVEGAFLSEAPPEALPEEPAPGDGESTEEPPVDSSEETPIEVPAEQPAEQPAEKPAEQPAEKPAEESVKESEKPTPDAVTPRDSEQNETPNVQHEAKDAQLAESPKDEPQAVEQKVEAPAKVRSFWDILLLPIKLPLALLTFIGKLLHIPGSS